MNQATNIIKVMLADDHAVVRAGYKFLLSNCEDMEVVAEVSSGEEALEHYSTYKPDILVIDLTMPGIGGLEAIRRLMVSEPEACILVFTMHENTAFVEQALQAGVAGYISKNSSPDILITAIRKLAAGQTYVDGEIAQHMVIQKTRDRGSLFSELSSREFQILCMFAEAQTVEQIATELSLSSKTIANYLTQIKDKLQVSTTAELVRLAIGEGLVTV